MNNGEPMPNDKFKKFMNVLCNVYFIKWSKKKVMTDDDWTRCIDELDHIVGQGSEYPLCYDLGIALLREIERKH